MENSERWSHLPNNVLHERANDDWRIAQPAPWTTGLFAYGELAADGSVRIKTGRVEGVMRFCFDEVQSGQWPAVVTEGGTPVTTDLVLPHGCLHE